MKKITHLLRIGSLAATLLVACTEPDLPLTPEAPLLGYSIIDGDTVKLRNDRALLASQRSKQQIFGRGHTVVGDTVVPYKAFTLHMPPNIDPDLSKLKNNDDPDLKGKPLRMIAIGGSLTAGVRDGGYFNEGIETSYPNLVARQMKLKKFEQPKFDAQDYNGVGRRVPTSQNFTGGPVPKFKAAQNNTGVEILSEKQMKLKKYKEKDGLDNFGLPILTDGGYQPYGIIRQYNEFDPTYPINKEMALRVQNNQDKALFDKIFENKFDFFVLDVQDRIILDYAKGRDIRPNIDPKSVFWEQTPLNIFHAGGRVKFVWKLKDTKNVKGCILNYPNILDLPYFNIIKAEQVNEVVRKYNPNNQKAYQEREIFLPTSEIDSLLGSRVNPTLKRGLDQKRILSEFSYLNLAKQSNIHNDIKTYNQLADNISVYLKIPIVDVKTLYATIIKGSYVTHDGVKVDASYPHGNFFSNDGISPTAFGQAIIANEVIKTINSFYKTDIPLIPTRHYLSVK